MLEKTFFCRFLYKSVNAPETIIIARAVVVGHHRRNIYMQNV